MSGGSTVLTPRVQARSGRSTSVSKWATCPVACTPVSVRPAPVTRIGVTWADSAGNATWGSGMLSAGNAIFGAGVTYQIWFRDPGGACGSGFSFTSALEVLPEL